MACNAMLACLVYLDEFTYSCFWQAGTPSALPPGGDVTQTIQINSDSDFVAQEYNLTTDTGIDQTVALPDFFIQITRAGSGRNIMNMPQRVANFCGNYAGYSATTQNANFPGKLSITSLYQGNSTVQVRLQNRSTTFSPARVDFAMKGFKTFYQANKQGQVGNRQDIFHAL